jgi:hypothetical protein
LRSAEGQALSYRALKDAGYITELIRQASGFLSDRDETLLMTRGYSVDTPISI